MSTTAHSPLSQGLIAQLKNQLRFFETSTSIFTEEDSNAAPAPGGMTVAQQVAHTAHTVDWFLDGAFGGNGYDMDFEKAMNEIKKVTSLEEARAWLRRSYERAIEMFGNAPDSQLYAPVPNDQIMTGAPLLAVVHAMNDHAAHHRGALTVYARLLGKVAPMPYA